MSIFTPTMYRDIKNVYDSDSSDSSERAPTITWDDSDSDSEVDSDCSRSRPVQVDSIVYSVLSKFVNRANFGKEKYGTDLDREDLTFLDWVNHAQEEHMDAILYLEKIRKVEMKRLTETSSHSDSWKTILNCLIIFLGVVTYNIIIVKLVR